MGDVQPHAQDAAGGSHARPRAVLVGLPGAGKSTVGALLARELGVTLVDSDAEIEHEAGRSISDIFADAGEPGFRALEHRVVARLLDTHPGVLALGGGAPTQEALRNALVRHPVVHLAVSPESAASRVSGTDLRPLLADGPEARLAELARQRGPLYAGVARFTVVTDGRTPESVAAEVRDLLATAPRVVPVAGEPGYDVLVGRGLQPEVVQLLGAEARRALVVHPAPLARQAAGLAERIEGTGRQALLHEVPDGEQAKTLEVLSGCWDVLGEHRFGRRDTVVALGGGATTDLAGFVAATWLRGVRVVQVPTTVLAMVDAAVGGKTGINTTAGKNLVGAFHPPAGVVCDLDVVTTLPEADLRAGLAEVVKCGFIADEAILHLLEGRVAADLHDPGSPVLTELVERAVAVKADVVGQDLRESGLRETLNYGHTLAHAIERTEGYRWRHGDAVAVGMVFAAELARLAGLLDPSVVQRHREVLSALGLPTSYRGDRWEQLLDAMRNDKKVRGDVLRFVVLTDVGQTTILTGPTTQMLREAYRAVSSPGGTRGTVAS